MNNELTNLKKNKHKELRFHKSANRKNSVLAANDDYVAKKAKYESKKHKTNKQNERKNKPQKLKMTGFPFPLIQEAKAKDELNKFHDTIRNKITMCTICHEAWPIKEKITDKYICTRCVRDKGSPKTFS